MRSLLARIGRGLLPGARRKVWLATARPEQLPPVDHLWWYVWMILAGRGWGKTRTGSEHVAQFARDTPGAQIAVIGRTDAEARRILLNGPSGLLSVLEPSEIARKVESPGDTRLYLTNGSVIYVVGAESFDALRGTNLHMAWCDELAAWRHQNVLWNEVLLPAVRIGDWPHIIVTTTPRATKLIRELVDADDTYLVRGSTFDNAANLAARFIQKMRAKFEGTRAGRQELYAELLDDVPGALLTRAQLEKHRVEEVPHPGLREVVVALDPSDGDEESDQQAITVAGLGWDHYLYVTHSEGMRVSPVEFVRRGLELAHDHGGTLVVERNHGGKYLTATIDQVMRDLGYVVPYRTVYASEGKRTRAEPVAALFEQGRARLVGVHADLEDQLTSWTGAAGEASPDILDSTVWALSVFLGRIFDAEEPAAHEYAAAAPAPTTEHTTQRPGYGYAQREGIPHGQGW